MLNICLVGIEYPNETGFGGIATYQKRMAYYLSKLNCNVTVICGTLGEDKDYYEDNIHIIRLHTNRETETIDTFNEYRQKVKETIIKLDNIDIVETPEFSGEIVEFLKNRNIPVVVKMHTPYKMWSDLNNISLPSPLHEKVIESERLSMIYSDKLICCSSLLKGLINNYFKEVDPNRIEVVPNPADTYNFYPTENNHKSKTILYCGSLEKRKGMEILANSIPLVLDELNDSEIKFQIIGNSEESKTSFLSLIDPKYYNQIEFLGHVNNDTLNKYYNDARIGVVPSLFDNLPYVAMEELLTELPIVASNNTGVKEMIEDNISGLLYDPLDYKSLANNIIKLYKDESFAQSCGNNGRKEILNRFDPVEIAKKNIEIYIKTIEEFNNKKEYKMHVCLTNFEYPSETRLGGISTYQKRIADALYAEGCKVTVICGSFDSYKDYYEDGIHVIRIPKNFPYKTFDDYYGYRDLLSNKIKEINEFDKIDIIESPELSAEMIRYFENQEIPVVTKLHTSYTIISAMNEGYSMFPDFIEEEIRKNENLLLDKSNKIICCSALLKDLMYEYHKSDKLDTIEVVGNPADIVNFYPTKNNHNSKTILYCGNLIKRKGIFSLAEAIPMILDKLNDNEIKIQLIGSYDGAEQSGTSTKDTLLSMIPEKYHNQLEFLGQVDHSLLNKYYNEARIGVIPSLFDNLPYVAMEELLTELPIAASNNTGIREMIEDNISGLLFDPTSPKEIADAVIKLYENPEFARNCGINGRKEILKKYSPSVIAKKNIEIYFDTIMHYRKDRIVSEAIKKFKLKDVKKISSGGTNIVRECIYNNTKCILKVYDEFKTYNYDLFEYVLDKLTNCNKLIFKDKIDNYRIHLYSYIDGDLKTSYSKNDIELLVSEINNINSINHEVTDTIYNKINNYFDYFKNDKVSLLGKKIYDILYKCYKVLNINQDNLSIVHGDLSITNILWNGNKPYIIDFDECTFAEKEYEYASLLLKICFHDNFFDIKTAKDIISIYKKHNINIDKVSNYYYFYIIKVIIEKWYYHELLGLNLYTDNQAYDNWLWWYKLLNNHVIFDVLFNEYNDYEIKEKLKDDYKSTVYKISINDENYVLKIENEYNIKTISNEQAILCNVNSFISSPGLLNYFEKDNKIYKIFEYASGDNRYCENIDTYLSMMIKCFDKISKFIDCEEGDIVEKLNLFKSSIKDEYVISQIDLLLSDNEFINKFNNEEKVIIHDDLNVNNILYDGKKLSFVDFSGLKKYTKSMQVASFITLYYLCEDREVNVVNFVNKIDSKLDINQINKLILFRLIKAYYYVSNNYDYRINTIYNKIKEWSYERN